jgi:hypothetical protein
LPQLAFQIRWPAVLGEQVAECFIRKFLEIVRRALPAMKRGAWP